MPSAAQNMFDFGDILGTKLDSATNTILAQTGDSVGQKEVDSDDAEYWQHVGFASRPAKASEKKSSAQAISIVRTDRDCIIATRDIRTQSIFGSLLEGETCLYSTGPDADQMGTNRVLLKDDGSVATITLLNQLGNQSNGNPILCQLSSNGTITMSVSDKAAFSMSLEGVKLVASDGDIQLGCSGQVTLIGASAAINAGAVSLGANASEGVMMSTQMLAWITQVNVALGVIAGAAGQAPNPTIVVPTAVPIASTSVKVAS